MDQCTDLNSLDPLSEHILVQQVVVLWLEYAGSSQKEERTDHIDCPLHLHCQVAPPNELSYPNLVRTPSIISFGAVSSCYQEMLCLSFPWNPFIPNIFCRPCMIFSFTPIEIWHVFKMFLALFLYQCSLHSRTYCSVGYCRSPIV